MIRRIVDKMLHRHDAEIESWTKTVQTMREWNDAASLEWRCLPCGIHLTWSQEARSEG